MGLWDWLARLTGRKGAKAPVPGAAATGVNPFANPASAEVLADLRAHVARDVAAGYLDEGEILRDALQVFEEEGPVEVLRPVAQAALRESLARHRAEQASWPAVTDYDRLDAAFVALEESGIVARQNFTCCGTCGSSEIWDEIEEARADGRDVRGYAFFHMQDTESAVEGCGLYLGYGAVEDGEAAALAIGREVVAAIEAHGLSTDWDGSWERRIHVAMDWKRRRGVVAHGLA